MTPPSANAQTIPRQDDRRKVCPQAVLSIQVSNAYELSPRQGAFAGLPQRKFNPAHPPGRRRPHAEREATVGEGREPLDHPASQELSPGREQSERSDRSGASEASGARARRAPRTASPRAFDLGGSRNQPNTEHLAVRAVRTAEIAIVTTEGFTRGGAH